MYGKLFRSMYDGSLCDNWKALVTFQQMIILCDSQGVVDMTPEAIARTTNIPLEIIKEGIAELEKPDPNSRTPNEHGKRLVRIDAHRGWGWRIVNHQYYKSLASYEDKKTADRMRIAQKREKAKKSKDSKHVASSRKKSQVSHIQITDTNTNKDSYIYCPKFEQIWALYPRKIEKKRAHKAYLNRVRNGWKSEQIMQAVKHYAQYCQDKEPQHIKHGSTFFGPNEPFTDFLEGVPKESESWKETFLSKD